MKVMFQVHANMNILAIPRHGPAGDQTVNHHCAFQSTSTNAHVIVLVNLVRLKMVTTIAYDLMVHGVQNAPYTALLA